MIDIAMLIVVLLFCRRESGNGECSGGFHNGIGVNSFGSGFFNKVSADLQRELLDVKGLSPTNIKYFKYFYELYSPLLGNRKQVVDESSVQNCPQVADNFNSQIIPQVADDLFCIPWDHHRRIIDKMQRKSAKSSVLC